ncbi:MAG: hypothetical protein ABS76_14215 [Pelagibacterium sp. SCN 64-44]|nr:MAG: hypothetical protein ABS76_14215 [Pelagibacterium sp. SCN 64-44]
MADIRARSIRFLCFQDHGDDPATMESWIGDGSPAKFLRLLDDANAHLVVAEEDGAIVGLGARHGNQVTLNYVDPDHRFKGISKEIMLHLQAQMSAEGLKLAYLNSSRTAAAFYLVLGWHRSGVDLPDGSIPMSMRLGG